jgi:hypothetical protein
VSLSKQSQLDSRDKDKRTGASHRVAGDDQYATAIQDDGSGIPSENQIAGKYNSC